MQIVIPFFFLLYAVALSLAIITLIIKIQKKLWKEEAHVRDTFFLRRKIRIKGNGEMDMIHL